MKSRLCIFVLSLIPSTNSRADDYSASVDALKRNQAELNQMISPYKTLAGFKSPEILSGSSDREAPPVIKVHSSMSRLQAPAGKLLFGKTINRLVVGGEASPAIIQLRSNQGPFSDLRILAQASQSSTPGRLGITVQKVIFRSGSAQPLQGMVLDQQGASGVEAQVLSQKALSIAGALGSSFISGLAASQQSMTSNAFGFESPTRNTRNSILGGLAQTAADQSKRFIEEATEERPIMILEAGTQVTVFLQEEVRF